MTLTLFKGSQNVLITGGTGSLGKTLLRRILSGEVGYPGSITVLSRDEAKQDALRAHYSMDSASLRNAFQRLVQFRIGDVRDYATVAGAVQNAQVIFNAAAMKQVPTCEFWPWEAVKTNIEGAENIIRAVQEHPSDRIVVGISTDKACKPVNVMGMSKAIQERLFLSAETRCPNTRFVCVRYGNVLASRGSVIPLFKEQIDKGGPVTITTPRMTRFLLSLNQAVDTVFDAMQYGEHGDTWIPRIPSALVKDVADVLIDGRNIPIQTTGIRPGEKIHEILVSEEELPRTLSFITPNDTLYYVVKSVLQKRPLFQDVQSEYSSSTNVMNQSQVRTLLVVNGLL